MRHWSAALLALALCIAPGGARAEEPDATSSLRGLELGAHWYGAQVTKEDLAGKVVLFVRWGS